MQPKLREVPAAVYFVSRHYVHVSEIPHIGGSTLPKVESDIPKFGLTVAGPAVFFYFDFNPESRENHLEVGFPVEGAVEAVTGLPDNYHLRKAGPFKCLSWDYVGGMPGINDAWCYMFESSAPLGYALGTEQREVYKKWVEFDSPDNVTELQIQVLTPPFSE